jgi:phenylacetic acid degradation operon negative regulatory protein
LIGSIRPLTARSVLATALLGANEPRLRVAELIAAASLFGIGPGATRTCLSRMAANGELTSDDGSYALSGHLVERRHRIDDAARHAESATRGWDGTWETTVVLLERRAAADRLELRKAAKALHLAEIREGVWTRPANLDRGRLPKSRAVLDAQCVHFWAAKSDIEVEDVRSLFAVDAWSRDAKRLIRAMEDELDVTRVDDEEVKATLSYQFALSIAVVRHLQLDALLPAAFLREDWPAATLRATYRRFDDAFQRHMKRARRER